MSLWMASMLALAMPVEELDWRVVNDTVMGGVSQSRVRIDEMVSFSGVLSLERNGGFASMRATVPPGSLEDAAALRLVLDGDGRTYDLTLRRWDVPLRAGSYRVRIPTEVGRTEVTVPLSAFRPMSYGRPVPGAPALDTGLDRIDTIGVMLADKQPGPFALDVWEVSVVPATPMDSVSRAPLLADLVAAIETGVPLFNGGDPAGARSVYTIALTSALGGSALTDGERSLASEALERSGTQAPDAGAWTLRAAMDSVLAAGR